MAGSRTLKLSILADIDNLKKNLGQADNEIQGFGGKLEKFGKVAAAAFAAAAAAAAAYAGKLAIDGVKAAIEDEAAQSRLAKALENVTGATNTQIAAVEKQIEKMSLAFGISDEQLRPSFQRLATATGDLAQAQDGLQLALDISAATGKSVEAVSNALGKAYEGNTGALSRLGIGLSSAEIKSLGLKGTMDQLAATFGGAATTQANTLEGQIQRLKIGFDEAKESVGEALLPAIKAFFDYVMNRLIPILIEAKDKALEPIRRAFENNKEAIQTLWEFTKNYLVPLFEFAFVKAIEVVGYRIATLIEIIGKVVSAIKAMIREAIDGINSLISLINKIPGVNIPGISLGGGGGAVGNFQMSSGSSLGSSAAFGGLVGALGGLGSSLAGLGGASLGGSGSKGGGTPGQLKALKKIEGDFALLQQLLGQLTGQELVVPMNQTSAEELRFGRGVTINVNAPSVIDEVGFTRAVVDAMNSVERTSAGGYSALFK
jgi:hypothetical protein